MKLAFGRTYAGELCEFGEPIFGYVIPTTKATAKWKRMVFLGKADIQNSYVASDGQSILLTRSVRRINTECIICIVGVFHGSTKLGLEQEACQL